jgi:hypothetical protein
MPLNKGLVPNKKNHCDTKSEPPYLAFTHLISIVLRLRNEVLLMIYTSLSNLDHN